MSEIKLIGALTFGFLVGIAAMKLDGFEPMREQYRLGFENGTKDALRMNPASEELELVCAGLWIGEQNRIYLEREARKK